MPVTRGTPRSEHSARIRSKASAWLKSIATSNAGTPDNSLAANRGTPSTTRWLGLRDTAATTLKSDGAFAASHSRAWPMRPEAPWINNRIGAFMAAG